MLVSQTERTLAQLLLNNNVRVVYIIVRRLVPATFHRPGASDVTDDVKSAN